MKTLMQISTTVLFVFTVLMVDSLDLSAQNFSTYPIIVRPLGTTINSTANDYAPVTTADKSIMYFTSYRSSDSHGEADVFLSKRKGDAWTASANAGASFNTDANDGSISISGDGQTIVFAADDRDDGYGDTDLYIAEFVDSQLQNIRNLGAQVNSPKWDSQPTITGDGRTIFFASARKGGIGGTDIWMTTLKPDGSWSDAVVLSRSVNTKKDERSPFITPDGGALYFASNGFDGYGKKDIFMCVFEHGEWTQPVNLGPIINSPEDELFFYAPKRDEQFYFASAREGGYGGLDVYAGTPNVFGAGMFRLSVSVLDSISRKSLPSIVTIYDEETKNALASFVTNAQASEYTQLLPANRTYRIEAQIRDYPTRSIIIADTPPRMEKHVDLLFGPITIAEFDLGKYNVPFFVTGYYRPNTRTTLDSLYSLLDGELDDANYIERFKKGSKRYQQYKAYAETVEGIFQTVYTAAIDEIFPRFKTMGLPNEVLQITVTGYADPQPILGHYLESETIRFDDLNGKLQSVSKGDAMDNLNLSGLRAWHSAQYLDEIFTDAANKEHTEYVDLKKAGKIRYRHVGGDVSNDNSDYAVQRRIRITIARIGELIGERGEELEFDLNKKWK